MENAVKQREKNHYLVEEVFFNKQALSDVNVKILKLRAYQYFQKEYVCILNLFIDKKDQFLTLLSMFLKRYGIDFFFLESFQFFTFISSSDIDRLSNLVLQFVELIRPNLAHFVYNYQNLKYGKIRLQLLIRLKSKQQEIQVENLLKTFNCVTYAESKCLIAFFFDYKGFVASQIELKKNSIEYDFYYSQPRVVRREVHFDNIQRSLLIQLRQKLDYFYGIKNYKMDQNINQKNRLMYQGQPIKDLTYYIDFSFISFYKINFNKEFIELIQIVNESKNLNF
ncbi:hypothetical protein ABPG74_022077 [Tetrahymena malaccensis]